MNTQRFVWAATAVLFALVGAMLGYALGQEYIKLAIVKSSNVSGYIIPTLAISGGIVAARLGSFLADRSLLPAIGRLGDLSVADRVLGITGALMGLFFGVLVTLPIGNGVFWLPVKFCIMAVGAGLGMAFFQGMRTEMLRAFPQLQDEPVRQVSDARPKFLDTNIIIDGRLADLCETGFIDGPIYVPSFVLEEVQYVADSADSLRRARGRRGLDVLNAMKEMTVPHTVNGQVELVPMVHVLNEIPPAVQKISAVDSKLVALARDKNGAIITNDFNLNKVAELQGVQVLNLNELVQALKPVVLPGEEMQVTIVKEGKESHQGVGYLEDGTMVVVGDGIQHIGETLNVIISSVYQTVAGKMIFADLREEDAVVKEVKMKGSGDDLFGNSNGHGHEKSEGRSSRNNNNDDFGHRTGGGMRRKGRS